MPSPGHQESLATVSFAATQWIRSGRQDSCDRQGPDVLRMVWAFAASQFGPTGVAWSGEHPHRVTSARRRAAARSDRLHLTAKPRCRAHE
jgi:hypothetical protein